MQDDFINPNITSQVSLNKTILNDKGEIIAFEMIKELPEQAPIPPCNDPEPTIDDLPVRGAAYVGCCCIQYLGYDQITLSTGRYLFFKLRAKNYRWSSPANYRNYYSVKHNGNVILEEYILDENDLPSCETYGFQGGVGIKLKDGQCPGHIEFIARKEYRLSDNVWRYCSQTEGEFDCL
ncbi:MAG: hypothetical protein JNL70_03670 [Saprospiraceae bacterium]|nr:hypothetical protein [Saprospiraceae bacterium]